MRDGITLRVIVFTKEPSFCFLVVLCLVRMKQLLFVYRVNLPLCDRLKGLSDSVCKNVFDANLFGFR